MKFLYEAKDRNGKLQRGAVDATSAQDALYKLGQLSLADIRLVSSETTAVLRSDLDKLPAAELQKHASTEVAFQRTRTMSREILLSLWLVTRNNASYLAMAALYLCWAIYRPSPLRLMLAAGLLVYPYVLLVWNRRRLDHYRELQRAMALGQWAAARRLLGKLRAQPGLPELMAKNLDFREVQVDVREGLPVEQAIKKLEPWRQRLQDSPGAFTGGLLGVYLAARDYPGYLAAARAWQAALPEAGERKVELALAETRFGDLATARAWLDSVDTAQLTPVALRFYDWAGGLLALAEGNTRAALPLLAKTVDEYQVFSRKTPMGLGMLALSTGAYALALARSGEKARGQALLKDVDTPLRLAIYPGLQQLLEAELDWPGWVGLQA